MNNEIAKSTSVVTDRDMFNIISEKLQKQNARSVSTIIDEDDGEIMEGDGCKYFGYNEATGETLRCGVGWIMNQDIYNNKTQVGVDIEDNIIDDEGPLSVVILSNPGWNFDKASWVMLAVIQRIHDSTLPKQWYQIFQNMSYLFDSNGKFTPSNLKSFELASDDDLWKEETLDLESVGISMVLPKHKSQGVNLISEQIEHHNVHDFLSNKTTVNMLDVETPQMSDVANINFLEIFSGTPVDKKKEKDTVNAK